MPSSTKPGGSQRLIGQIRSRGLPLTRASFLIMMFHPDDPEFPLDAEDEAQVRNSGLDGPMPTTFSDLYPGAAPKSSTSRPAAPATEGASSSATTPSR